MRRLHSHCSLILILLLISCNTKKDVALSSHEDVYAAGHENFKATIWKNDSAILLANSTGSFSFINDIVIINDNIYACGYGTAKDEKTYIAKYWKDGIETNLTDGKSNAYATGIVLDGNDVYVAGVETVPIGNENYRNVAKYWKNGVAVLLSDNTVSAQTGDILLNNNDVYVSGVIVKDDEKANLKDTVYPCYWKNGNLISLTGTNFSNTSFSTTSKLYQAKNEIYAMWTVVDDNLNCKTSYSKNFGNPVVVQSEQVFTYGRAFTVSDNGDLFIASKTSDLTHNRETLQYWKNGNYFPILDDKIVSDASSITVSGNDVYIGGQYGYKPCYWKNGTLIVLGSDKNIQSSLTVGNVQKVVVVKK